jgi:hypothetical protein
MDYKNLYTDTTETFTNELFKVVIIELDYNNDIKMEKINNVLYNNNYETILNSSCEGEYTSQIEVYNREGGNNNSFKKEIRLFLKKHNILKIK